MSTLLHLLVLLSVCFIYPMFWRYCTNRDRKSWPGLEIKFKCTSAARDIYKIVYDKWRLSSILYFLTRVVIILNLYFFCTVFKIFPWSILFRALRNFSWSCKLLKINWLQDQFVNQICNKPVFFIPRLPVFKSSSKALLPLLCMVSNLAPKAVFPIHGNVKTYRLGVDWTHPSG